MKMDVSYYHFKSLIEQGYTLDLIFLLKLVEDKMDVYSLRTDHIKIEAFYQTLLRKGLITDKNELSLQGKELLKFMSVKGDKSSKLKKKIDTTPEFENWWTSYPGTDNFTFKGRSFIGSRTLRQNKEDCKIKFNKILQEGEYTAKQLIDALLYDVESKKTNSYKTGNNKLSFMQNSATYLNQRSFEPFIELLKEGIQEDVSSSGGVEI